MISSIFLEINYEDMILSSCESAQAKCKCQDEDGVNSRVTTCVLDYDIIIALLRLLAALVSAMMNDLSRTLTFCNLFALQDLLKKLCM